MTPIHPSTDLTDLSDIHREIEKSMSLTDEQKKQKARIDIYDFAGELVFKASHPTFMSARAIYILTLDMNKMLNPSKERILNINDTKTCCECTIASLETDTILFWLKTVIMFATPKDKHLPQVILVGTHSDKLPRENRDEIVSKCFLEIRCSLPLKCLLSTKEYVVNTNR